MSAASLHELGLRPAQLRAVERKAKTLGQTPPEYVRLLVERELLADSSFDEILRPVRADFKAKGITEEQLDHIVYRARHHPKRPGNPAKRRKAGIPK
jgi:hypothetical protein